MCGSDGWVFWSGHRETFDLRSCLAGPTIVRVLAAMLVLGWSVSGPAAAQETPESTSTAVPVADAARPAGLRGEARRVVSSALPLLQRSADQWIQRKTCTSCHHQTLGLVAVRVASDAGFPVHDGLAAKQVAHIRRSLGRSNTDFAQGIGPSTFGVAYGAWGLALSETSERTMPVRALSWMLSMQQVNGQLPSFSHRPPMEHRSATGTALLVHAVRRWGLHVPDAADARERAGAWLEQHRPKDTESAAWRLLGLYWQGVDVKALEAAAQPLLDDQQLDGGWRQHALRPTDAYATALALSTLLQTGQLGAADPRAIRAVRWLLEDFDHEHSAWRVATRRRVEGLPYFESGYPFGEDQFISYGASAWATTALSLFLREGPSPVLSPPEAVDGLTESSICGDLSTLLCTARWGAPEGFAEQVASAPAESIALSAEDGLHLLMAAASEPAKLAVVLDRWTGPIDSASEPGRTALHIATLAPNASDARRAVDLLLRRGADPNVADAKGVTPLHLAARRADTTLVDLLLRAGAETSAVALGIDGMTPLGAAIGARAVDVVAQLLAAGADPLVAMKAYGSDALQEAVYSDEPEIVEILLSDPPRTRALIK